MSEPVPPGLYPQPPQGPPPWAAERPPRASDPTVLSTGQVIPRQSMPLTGGGDGAFTVDLAEAPRVLRDLRATRDELLSIRADVGRLGQIDPETDDEVSRDAASVFGAVATGGSGSLLVALDGAVKRVGDLIDAMESELASYRTGEQGIRERFA